MKLILHQHQTQAVAAIENQFAQGKKRTLAVLATGTGKTIIYLHLADKWSAAGKRVLILAHRRELINQPMERALQFYPELARRMGVVMASMDESQAQVVVATIQTVNRDRLTDQKFDYVILDEAHHGTAKSYMKMVERFPDAKWLGLTATPFRTDGDGLSKLFDSVAYRFTINTAIDQCMLVPFDAYGFTIPVTLAGLEEDEEGEFNDKELGDLLSAGNVLDVVYQKWHEYCQDRRTICFTASVAQAHSTAAYFRKMGVEAEAVDGTTKKPLRDRILKDFISGKVQVVMNCQVWTEGVDVPEASAALMVCPTRSDLAYVQKLGRILRTHKDKKTALVLDFAPAEDRNLVMAGDILGVPRIVKKAEEKAAKSGVLVGVSHIDDHGIPSSIDPSEIMVEALKYLGKGLLAWTIQDYMAVAPLSEKTMLAIELPDPKRIAKAEALKVTPAWTPKLERLYEYLLQYRLWIVRKDGMSWKSAQAAGFADMNLAIKSGEESMESEYRPSLAKKSRQWRHRPISEGQVKYMYRLGIHPPKPCNQGQAAQLISYAIATQSINRVRGAIEQQVMAGGL